MACFTNTCNQLIATSKTNTTNNTTNDATIGGLLKRIDQMQKNAILNNQQSMCDNCVINMMYNTKPINIYCGCTPFSITIDDVTSTLFRVEEVRGLETVVLRLLETDATTNTITCTTNTFVMRIDCICAVVCNQPINCAVACFPTTTN